MIFQERLDSGEISVRKMLTKSWGKNPRYIPFAHIVQVLQVLESTRFRYESVKQMMVKESF